MASGDSLRWAVEVTWRSGKRELVHRGGSFALGAGSVATFASKAKAEELAASFRLGIVPAEARSVDVVVAPRARRGGRS